MAIDIKVIPTLHGDEAMRFIHNADEVLKSKERVDFSEKIAIARAILKKSWNVIMGFLLGKTYIYEVKFTKSGQIIGAPKDFFDTYMIDVMDIAMQAK